MSLVELRVELPAYAHSFLIQVPSSCTIIDVKQEIFRTCIGAPRVEGQRIVWRGRYLVDDEKVDELWKSLDEPRIVHLAVHPSAWSSTPPEIPQISQPPFTPPSPAPPAPSPQLRQIMTPAPPAPHPLAYVLFKHQNALIALMGGRIVQARSNSDLEPSRSQAIQAVERNGWLWPPILDEEFPAATEGGPLYERTIIEGQPYLTLRNSSATPTPLQAHALKVLTYTFTLLSIPLSPSNATRTAPSQTVPLPPNINMLLQQLGLPPLRVAQNHNQNRNQNGILPELREMPLRPLLAPLLMLLFRTLLLLYFVAPARKPIFGVLILAWMLYEIWRPIRNNLLRGWRHGPAEDQQRPNAPPAQPDRNPAPDAQEAQRPPANAPGGGAANRIDTQAAVVFETLANINIPAEEQIINDVPGAVTIEPGLGHKITTFFGLLLTTVHPAVWNRRRIALGRREGRIRTEANMRETAEVDIEGDEAQNENRARLRTELRAQHTRRPRWVQDYMERVVAGEWVDESD